MLAFSPLNLTHGQHSLVRSFELSSSQTKQAKLNIFITFLLVNSLVLTGQNLLNLVVFENPVSYALLDSFFFAARCLIFARAWAILFITLGLRYPFVVQSEA